MLSDYAQQMTGITDRTVDTRDPPPTCYVCGETRRPLFEASRGGAIAVGWHPRGMAIEGSSVMQSEGAVVESSSADMQPPTAMPEIHCFPRSGAQSLSSRYAADALNAAMAQTEEHLPTSVRAVVAMTPQPKYRVHVPIYDERELIAKAFVLRKAALGGCVTAFSKVMPFLPSGLRKLGVLAAATSGTLVPSTKLQFSEKAFAFLFSKISGSPKLSRVVDACVFHSLRQLSELFSRTSRIGGQEDDNGYLLRSQVALGDVRDWSWNRLLSWASLTKARRYPHGDTLTWFTKQAEKEFHNARVALEKTFPSPNREQTGECFLISNEGCLTIKYDRINMQKDDTGKWPPPSSEETKDAVVVIDKGFVSVTGSGCVRVLGFPATWIEAVEVARVYCNTSKSLFLRALKYAVFMKISDSLETFSCGCSELTACHEMPALCLMHGFDGVGHIQGAQLEWFAERLYGAQLLSILHSIVRRVKRGVYSLECGLRLLGAFKKYCGIEETTAPVSFEMPLVGCLKVGCPCGPVLATESRRKDKPISTGALIPSEKTAQVELTTGKTVPMPIIGHSSRPTDVVPCTEQRPLRLVDEVDELPRGIVVIYGDHRVPKSGPPDVGLMGHLTCESVSRYKENGNGKFTAAGPTVKILAETAWPVLRYPIGFGTIDAVYNTEKMYGRYFGQTQSGLPLAKVRDPIYENVDFRGTQSIKKTIEDVISDQNQMSRILSDIGRSKNKRIQVERYALNGMGVPQLKRWLTTYGRVSSDITFIARGILAIIEFVAENIHVSVALPSEDDVVAILQNEQSTGREELANKIPKIPASNVVYAAMLFKETYRRSPALFYALGAGEKDLWSVMACRRRWQKPNTSCVMWTMSLLKGSATDFYKGEGYPNEREGMLATIISSLCAGDEIWPTAKTAVDDVLRVAAKVVPNDTTLVPRLQKLVDSVRSSDALPVDTKTRLYTSYHEELVAFLDSVYPGGYVQGRYAELEKGQPPPKPVPSSPTRDKTEKAGGPGTLVVAEHTEEVSSSGDGSSWSPEAHKLPSEYGIYAHYPRRLIHGVLQGVASVIQQKNRGNFLAHSRWGSENTYRSSISLAARFSAIEAMITTKVTPLQIGGITKNAMHYCEKMQRIVAAKGRDDISDISVLPADVTNHMNIGYSEDSLISRKQAALLALPVTWALRRAKNLTVPIPDAMLPSFATDLKVDPPEGGNDTYTTWAISCLYGPHNGPAALNDAIALLAACAVNIFVKYKRCPEEAVIANSIEVTEKARTNWSPLVPAFFEHEFSLILGGFEKADNAFRKAFWKTFDNCNKREEAPLVTLMQTLAEVDPVLVVGPSLAALCDPSEKGKEASSPLESASSAGSVVPSSASSTPIRSNIASASMPSGSEQMPLSPIRARAPSSTAGASELQTARSIAEGGDQGLGMKSDNPTGSLGPLIWTEDDDMDAFM